MAGLVPGQAPFLPKLEYTDSGFWEDSPLSESAEDVTLEMFRTDGDGAATGASFRQGDNISFVISGFGKTSLDRGLIVWFEVRTVVAESHAVMAT